MCMTSGRTEGRNVGDIGPISVQGAEGQSILKVTSIPQDARDGSIRNMNYSGPALPLCSVYM